MNHSSHVLKFYKSTAYAVYSSYLLVLYLQMQRNLETLQIHVYQTISNQFVKVCRIVLEKNCQHVMLVVHHCFIHPYGKMKFQLEKLQFYATQTSKYNFKDVNIICVKKY